MEPPGVASEPSKEAKVSPWRNAFGETDCKATVRADFAAFSVNKSGVELPPHYQPALGVEDSPEMTLARNWRQSAIANQVSINCLEEGLNEAETEIKDQQASIDSVHAMLDYIVEKICLSAGVAPLPENMTPTGYFELAVHIIDPDGDWKIERPRKRGHNPQSSSKTDRRSTDYNAMIALVDEELPPPAWLAERLCERKRFVSSVCANLADQSESKFDSLRACIATPDGAEIVLKIMNDEHVVNGAIICGSHQTLQQRVEEDDALTAFLASRAEKDKSSVQALLSGFMSDKDRSTVERGIKAARKRSDLDAVARYCVPLGFGADRRLADEMENHAHPAGRRTDLEVQT
jgi:hypothetical protein